MRALAWAVGALVALPLIAYLVLVAVNWNDEPPSADARHLAALIRDRPPLEDAANGYIHALGIAAAADVDPVALGSARSAYIETFVSPPSAGDYPALPGKDADYRAARSEAVAALSSACGEASACADALGAHPDAVASWLASERWMLERYRRMLATGAWREAVPRDAGTPLAGYQHVLEAQKLHLLAVRQEALAQDPAAVRALLEQDLVFWREAFASSDLLVSKMIAAAAIRRNLGLGNLALHQLPPERVLDAVPPSWRQPLTVAERSLARPLAGEWQVIGAALRMAMAPEAQGGRAAARVLDRLQRPLYQEQATLNLFAGWLAGLGRASESPYPELAQVLGDVGQPQEGASLWLRPYNVVGRVLASVAAPAYMSYIARTADIEGQRRATLLAASLRGAGIQHEGAATAVRDAPLRSPYDDTPFEWDAAGGAVVFQGLEQGERGRHAVAL